VNYCSRCGSIHIVHRIPDGDHRPRHVCEHCGEIFYENPRIVAGTLPEWQDQILLCRRAIEPRLGFWTLPAGFMENGETTVEAALRETWEEAHARVEPLGLYSLVNLPQGNQVFMIFRGRLLDLDFGPGAETLETRLFREEEIPWEELAFATVQHTLRFYLADRRAGAYGLHVGDIVRGPDGPAYHHRRPPPA
jgi:ADP-ribose pyrophosphatase YjhB (NUDIX family)